jgi:serine/threonine protein phosphatase 1
MSNLKKIFVVSDVHGHFNLLKTALDNAGFNNEDENHLLVGCGDYFDRGKENLEVLKFFERVKRKVLLKGNHEDLLLEVFKTGKFLPHNFINGTMTTLENLFGKYTIDPMDNSIDFSGKTRTVDRVLEFIGEMVNYFETENYVFVHGWLPPNANTIENRKNVSDKSWEAARWIKWTNAYNGERPLADKTIVCGHYPTLFARKFDETRPERSTEIFHGNGVIAIDAGTFETKTVNVLVLEDNLI